MAYEVLKNINQIIERDSKDTTYKFALLRATIEVIQQKTPHEIKRNRRISIPLGLLVLKWLEYYYPIIEAKMPQKKGDNLSSNTLSFRALFEEVTDYYESKGGYNLFYKEFIKCSYPDHLNETIYKLCKKIRDTIKKQPMCYIGRSVSDEFYSIYELEADGVRLSKPNKLDVEFMIGRFGRFTIPEEYYHVFEYLGSFLTGTHSIMINWAEFTVEKSNRSLNLQQVLPKILMSPLNERDTRLTEDMLTRYLKEEGQLTCVWSGKKIKQNLNIDHMLPFSVWRNNDLWNLLPTTKGVNSVKSDSIPSNELLSRSKGRIIGYWQFFRQLQPEIFDKELMINLLDKNRLKPGNWENEAFHSLEEKCRYLIEIRGFEKFYLQ
jgi:hypothetical protein